MINLLQIQDLITSILKSHYYQHPENANHLNIINQKLIGRGKYFVA